MRKLLAQYRVPFGLQQRKTIVLSSLAILSGLMMAVGIYFKQYFVVFVFCVWLCAEALLLRLQPLLRFPRPKKWVRREVSEEDELWQLYYEANENAEIISGLKLSEKLRSDPKDSLKKWAVQFRTLSQLNLLLESKTSLKGKKEIQQNIIFQSNGQLKCQSRSKQALQIHDIQIVSEAALIVSELLYSVQKIAEAEEGSIGREARILIEKVLGFSFEPLRARAFIDRLVDSIQRHSGVPFLILNLLRNGDFEKARELGRAVLANEIEVDEELRSTLYWIAEVEWFAKEKRHEVLDHDSAIRHLYHLCFTNPDRAGFLEIDSQFAGEFGPVNEIVEEGFVFKETLVEAVLETWEKYEGWFDGVFQNVLESMTGRKSKIYDERPNWERYWRQQKGHFSRDYLYVIEGNLCYSSGQLKDAQFCYEKAIEISPKLRSALFNLLMVSAELKDSKTHQKVIASILEEKEWQPLALSNIGNSYLLLGDEQKCIEYYSELKIVKGWEKKTDFYLSVFCFDRGFFEQALNYGVKAHQLNLSDSSISYHLSRCYSALGQKEAALQVFKKVHGEPGSGVKEQHSSWLNFYRFTLERDSGRSEEAVQTLLKIPKDYFQDPDELEAALEFARSRKDLSLLRHLKQYI